MAITDITSETGLLTADDLMRLHGEGVRAELIRGVLHETMPAGVRHGKIAAKLLLQLGYFVEPRKLGTLLTADPGVWLERDPDTVRAPDIAFLAESTMALNADIPGFAEVVPELVVEVRSPSDSRREARDKARMWNDHGVRLVWVVHPDTRTLDVHQPGQAVLTLTADDTLDGADVLAGFTCTLADIFGG